MLKLLANRFFFLSICLLAPHPFVRGEEVTIDFEAAAVGQPVPIYAEKDVRFQLARQPQKSRATGQVMFFPHLGDDHKGILNAMAEEAIPLRITLPKAASKAKLIMWGSTTSAAHVEAFDRLGQSIAKQELVQVPVRRSPEEQVPYFTLSLAAKGIVAIEVSGAQPGGFLAIDEICLTYEEQPEADPAAAP